MSAPGPSADGPLPAAPAGSAPPERDPLHFASARCSLGLALVAARAAGLAAVLLGDERAGLEAELARRFPRHPLLPGGPAFEPLLAAVLAALENPGEPQDLPLAPLGTPFQLSVWQALRSIPPGQTLSYGELARLLDAPKAVRAVAAACGANPLAVLVPCHRVIAKDGSLTGYRWGLDRKRALLAREESIQAAPESTLGGGGGDGRQAVSWWADDV